MSLQIRLWLTVVVIVVAGALVFVIGTSAMYERVVIPFETVQTQSIAAVNAALIRHGAEAVDAAVTTTIDPAVRSAAAKGSLTPEAEASLLARAGNSGAPSFALLVNRDGAVFARAGESKIESPLTGMSIFVEAASGLARDGRLTLDGTTWHIAAAPVFDGASLSAVIILGWPYDAAFADRLTQQVGAPVVLIANGKRMGSSLPELSADQLMMRGEGVGALDVKPLPAFLPLLVPDRTRYSVMSVPLFSGEHQLAIAVATDRNQALVAVSYAQALVIAGTLVIALLQIVLILSTMKAVSRQIEVIVTHLSQVSHGNSVGILPEASLSGQFLRLGKQVNMILQMIPSVSRPGAPLGSLSSSPLGPSALGAPVLAPLTEEPFSGLGGGLGSLTSPPRAATPASPPAAAPSSTQPPSALSSIFDDNGSDPLAAFRVPSGARPPGMPDVPPATAPPTPAKASSLPPEFEDAQQSEPELGQESTVMFKVPQELINKSAQNDVTVPHASPFAAPVSATAQTQAANDARTVIAQAPQDLVTGAAREASMSNADETHYKEVYAKFVETRVQCGEDTSDLTYDRFVAKLVKNRQQIIEKHKAKSVRFQVYVKEGKAALRALPVRE